MTSDHDHHQALYQGLLTLNQQFANPDQPFSRCNHCLARCLSEFSFDSSSSASDSAQLQAFVEQINLDYFLSADFRRCDQIGRYLQCGADCPHYEERREAEPFSFMLYQPELLSLLVDLVKKHLTAAAG